MTSNNEKVKVGAKSLDKVEEYMNLGHRLEIGKEISNR